MDPLIGSALIGGASSLIGNIFGKKSNDNANETNLRIAQMNNQWNERMLQKEMDYNFEMWQKQNDYNDPSAQRARMQAAGFNPYMALGQIGSGTAGSVGGVKTPSAQPVTVQPYQPDFSGIGQAAQSYVSNRIASKQAESVVSVNEAEANQLRIENQYKATQLVSEIMERMENTRNTKAKRIYQGIMNNYADEQFSSDIQLKNRQIQSIEADVRAKSVDTAIKELELAGFPKQFQLTLASMSADILLKSAQTKQTKQQTIHEVQKMFKTFEEKNNFKINNSILERTAKFIVDKAKFDVFKGHTLQSTAAGLGYTIGSKIKELW